MNRVVLATRNAGKVAELQVLLTEVELVGLGEVAAYDEPAETGATFAENALIKARAAVAATGLAAVADDSGLAVDALNGMPGVLSARWAGRHGDDVANLQLVLDQIADVPDERRGAAFVCAAAYVGTDGTVIVEEATWRGRLTREPLGDNGFGYDPIFVPEGQDRTSAQLEPAEKNAISHRAQAFRALAARLGS
ncbi:MAG TPA: RdgB/HAM1 family non-canonical purine NTP pyrophosphatase [Mycobacteriales bacterium]